MGPIPDWWYLAARPAARKKQKGPHLRAFCE